MSKEKNLQNIRDEFKRYGVFYTPIDVCKKIKDYIPFDVYEAYDPTCGQGNLLSVFDKDVKKYGQELFPEELEKAKDILTNFEGRSGDTLKDDQFKGQRFQVVISNPPYSVPYDPPKPSEDERFAECGILPTKSKADFAFILHCLYKTKEDGLCLILEHPGVLYRGGKEGEIRQWLVEKNYVERIVNFPAGLFVDTNIPTVLLILNKQKTTTDIIFEDLENGLSETVSVEKVKGHSFCLSVQTYIEKEEPKQEIDIDELNNQCRSITLSRIERDINYEVNMTIFFTQEYDALDNFLNSIINICLEKKAEMRSTQGGDENAWKEREEWDKPQLISKPVSDN